MKKSIKELGLKISGALLVVLLLGLTSCNKEDLSAPLSEAESNETYIAIQNGYYRCLTNNAIYTVTKSDGRITMAAAQDVIIVEYSNGRWIDDYNNTFQLHSADELRLYVSGTIVRFIKEN